MPRDSARLAERIWAKLGPAIVEFIEAEVGGDEPSAPGMRSANS